MGEHEGWAEPSGLCPNGLLPNAESEPMIRALDSERWSRAEERTAELIGCIQPNQPSEERRNAVADYVQRLIMKCFPCQSCSVPVPVGGSSLAGTGGIVKVHASWPGHHVTKKKKDSNRLRIFHFPLFLI